MLNENSLDCQAISNRLYKLRSGKEKEFIEDTEGKKKFKRSRKGKPKYSLEEIEQKTGINRASLAQMEESFSPEKITLSDLYALANCYGCGVGFLIGEYVAKTKDTQGAADFLGLSEESIDTIIRWREEEPEKLKQLEFLIRDDSIIQALDNLDITVAASRVNDYKKTVRWLKEKIYRENITEQKILSDQYNEWIINIQAALLKSQNIITTVLYNMAEDGINELREKLSALPDV